MEELYLDIVINKATNDKVCIYYHNRYIESIQCNMGEELKIKFKNDGSITHEKVVDIQEDDYGYWVETTKKLWKIDYKYNEVE